ncbi:MAG: tetratricopeptide repeat protein [Actinobacteria bacterium]|nr:tetratricopeptide repeat protein [Actinomycetota bacterium]
MRYLAAITIVLGLSAGALLGGVLNESRPIDANAGAFVRAQFGTRQTARDTVALVRQLQATLRANPKDAKSLTLLGLAYHQRYRESADPTYLTRATGLFRRSLELTPDDPAATSGLAGLALSRHQFQEALSLARSAQRLAPDSASSYGALGDSLVELGRYDEAFAAFDRMTELRPNLAAYARVAYARELLGRPGAAIQAMSLALDASGGRPEPAAWTLVELGKLHFNRGRLAEARATFRSALATLPGYVYALDWLARTEAAAGRYGPAARLAQRAIDAVPLPQFVATLADIERARGDERGARRQYALMGVIQRLLQANGVNSDLELALFRVDHGIRLAGALELARAARAARPSIYGDDVLAWALARNGRCADALRYSKRSLRLGTKDAGFYFHRGMIERCLGRKGAAAAWFARALETNSSFSLIWADTAERYAS